MGRYIYGDVGPHTFFLDYGALIRSLKFEKTQVFDHKFARSARIELRFWEVANLEKLNNFCHDHF